jgi:hypothetical protein
MAFPPNLQSWPAKFAKNCRTEQQPSGNLPNAHFAPQATSASLSDAQPPENPGDTQARMLTQNCIEKPQKLINSDHSCGKLQAVPSDHLASLCQRLT